MMRCYKALQQHETHTLCIHLIPTSVEEISSTEFIYLTRNKQTNPQTKTTTTKIPTHNPTEKQTSEVNKVSYLTQLHACWVRSDFSIGNVEAAEPNGCVKRAKARAIMLITWTADKGL